MTAFCNGSAPNIISNQTQWTMAQLLSDEEWVTQLVKLNQQRLNEAYKRVTGMLQEEGIPCTDSRGSLFIWADFSRYLEQGHDATSQEEEALWLRIFEESNVLLTGPGSFGHLQRGWFRIVFTCVTPEELDISIHRLRHWIQQQK